MAAKVHKENHFPANPRKTEAKKEAAHPGEAQHVDALQLQWLRLNSLFQHNEEGMAMTDDFGNLLMANQSFCKILRKTQAEVLEMRIQDLLPIKGLQEITAKAHLQAIARQGHYVIGTKLRDRRYLGVRHVVMEEGKDQHHLLLYVNELTEKIREQAKQTEKEEMLLQVLENSQEPFLLLDTALTITAFNTIGAQLLQQATSRSAEKGASILDYGKSEHQKERSWKLFREVLSGIIVERTMNFTLPGTAFKSIYKLTYLPFFDAEGKIYGIYISGRDITNRLTDAQTIAEKEVFQEIMQHGAHGAMLILTPQLIIRYASPAVKRLLGLEANAMTGEALSSFLAEPLSNNLLEHWHILGTNDVQEIEGLLHFRAGDGRIRQLRYTVYDYQQVPVIQGYVLQLSDASDLQMREIELVRLRRILQQKALYKANTVLVFDQQAEAMEGFCSSAFQNQFPALSQQGVSLAKILQLLGKQAGPSLKRLKANEVLAFEAEVMSTAGLIRLLQIHVERYMLPSNEFVYLLFIGDGHVSKEIERLAQHSSDAQQQLALTAGRYQRLLLLFERLQDITGVLPWVFELDRRQFIFHDSLLNSPLLMRKGKRGVALKVDAVHPADLPLLDALNQAPSSTKPQRFELRMLNEEGLYQPYLHWASYQAATRTWEGIWLALPSAQFSNGNPFLDLEEVWTKMGFGLMQISRYGLKLEYANEKAKSMMALLPEAIGLPIEAIESLKNTTFSKACQQAVLEVQDVPADYYHAPTALWMQLHFFVDVTSITVLLRK